MYCKIKARVLTHAISAFVAISCLTSAASAQWNERVLYSFQGGTDGALPSGGLIHDKLGNLYGMTAEGGAPSCPPGWCGTVYELSPPAQAGGAWTETLLYVFKGHDQNDGSSPSGGLIADGAGNFYGVTAYGGIGPCVLFGTPTGCGTVFELSPPATPGAPWIETVLYNFQGGNDGDLPTGSLVFDGWDNLYGATEFGGGQGTTCDLFYGGNCGTIFELSPPEQSGAAWTEKVLHSFAGPAPGAEYGDGALPNGGLVFDSTGVLYGTTFYGGNNVQRQCEGGVEGTGCGIVFALMPPTKSGGQWREKLLHAFYGRDGSSSAAGVVLDQNGNLYGTASSGGPIGADGLVFELTRPPANLGSWTEEILHVFTDGADGGSPEAGLTFDSEGHLFGAASQGGYSSQYGDVYALRPPIANGGKWGFGVLYGFHPPNSNPGQPASKLMLDLKGNLYGTTQYGGSGVNCNFGGCGTVFEISPQQ